MSKSTKPYKIMTLLITTFFICWLPFQILSVLELDRTVHSYVFHTAQQVSATLACANSFLNPFLYAFMAKNLKKKCYSFLSKIESAIDEETRSAFRATSITNSVDNRLSTAVWNFNTSHGLNIYSKCDWRMLAYRNDLALTSSVIVLSVTCLSLEIYK